MARMRFTYVESSLDILLQNVVTRSHRITRALASIGVQMFETTRLACTELIGIEMDGLGWDVETNDAQ